MAALSLTLSHERARSSPSHPAQRLMVSKCCPSNELSTGRSLSATTLALFFLSRDWGVPPLNHSIAILAAIYGVLRDVPPHWLRPASRSQA